MTVYIELFILDNLLINYYFLYLAGVLTKTPVSKKRLLFSATLGTVYALVQVSALSFLSSFIYKLIASVLMIRIAYRARPRTLIKLLTMFYCLSFVFAGLIVALYYSAITDKALNRLFFLPLPLRFALLIVLCGNSLKKYIVLLYAHIKYNKESVYLSLPKFSSLLECFCDTGNNCTYFGYSVIFVNINCIEGIDKNYLTRGNISDTSSNINTVYIPYTVAGGEIKTAPGFKCTDATIIQGSQIKKLCTYIALTNHSFNGMPCLINPSLLD